MEDTHAGGTAAILENALALAGAGRLDNAARARLWALVAGGVIGGDTAHALVEIDVQARGRAGQARKGGTGAAGAAAKRGEIRLAWADSVPWSIRGRIDLPLATWAVLGMLIARAGCTGDEWRAELSLTEMQRRLGGAGRKTVAGAVARLERAGFVRAIRRRRNPRFSEINIYILEHPEAARAATRAAWREEEAAQAPEAPARTGARAGASPGSPRPAQKAPSRANSGVPGGVSVIPGSSPVSNSSPKWTHINHYEDSTTKIHVPEPAQPSRTPKTPASEHSPTITACSSLQESKSRGLASSRPPARKAGHRQDRPPLAAGIVARLAAGAVAELDLEDSGGEPGRLWRIADRLLSEQIRGFDGTVWTAARARHGPRAALAVIETALVARIRAGTDDPIRSASAYLGGILRRGPAECRPEITLARLAAAREAGRASGRTGPS